MITTMKKILAILVLGLAFAATSCSDFFELKRPNQFPWQSASELEMAVRAPYLYYVGAAWSNPIGALTNRFGESDLAHFTGKTGDSRWYTGAGLCRDAKLVVKPEIAIARHGVCVKSRVEGGAMGTSRPTTPSFPR